ncbi:MAG: CBS domain-containing protein [Gemmataceae bacterium]
MATVRDILAKKGSHVQTIGPDATVMDAATLMNEHKIGSLVVLDHGHVVGMFTERDVLRRVVGQRFDPMTTKVHEVMTTEVIVCRPETTIEEVRGSMCHRRIRHLPVLDGGNKLIGMISIGDLNTLLAMDQEQTIHLLQEYMYGRV